MVDIKKQLKYKKEQEDLLNKLLEILDLTKILLRKSYLKLKKTLLQFLVWIKI